MQLTIYVLLALALALTTPTLTRADGDGAAAPCMDGYVLSKCAMKGHRGAKGPRSPKKMGPKKNRLCCTMESEATIGDCKGMKVKGKGCKCEKPQRPMIMKGEGRKCVGCEMGKFNKKEGVCVKVMKHTCPKSSKPAMSDDGDECVLRGKK